MAEGNFDKYVTSSGDEKFRVRVSQSDAPDGRLSRLKSLVDKNNIRANWIKRYSANSTEHGTHRNFDAYRATLLTEDVEWVYDYIDPYTKAPRGQMAKLSQRQARLFLMEYVWSDGYKNSSAKNSYQLATNSIAIRDYLQELAVIAGWRSATNSRPNNMWTVTFNTRSSVRVKTSTAVSVVDYSGKVWCVTVPNHTVVVRRNGKPFVAGNSHRIGMFSKSWEIRDEVLYGYEIGHMMDVPQATYSQVHNWQQGFAVGHHDTETGVGSIDIIPIHSGYKCYYGGKEFSLGKK